MKRLNALFESVITHAIATAQRSRIARLKADGQRSRGRRRVVASKCLGGGAEERINVARVIDYVA